MLLVSRGGKTPDWCFLCGDNHPPDASYFKATGIGHVLSKDLTLADVADLEPGWDAEREAPGKPWIRTKSEFVG